MLCPFVMVPLYLKLAEFDSPDISAYEVQRSIDVNREFARRQTRVSLVFFKIINKKFAVICGAIGRLLWQNSNLLEL